MDKEYILSPEVQRSDAKAQKIISSLFNEFKDNYKLVPLEIRKKIDDEINENSILGSKNLSDEEKEQIITRYIATYISTMSDTYAENMYRNLNGSKNNYSL